MTHDEPASLGDDVIDQMLRGGLPREQAVLLTGGPGTGKSSLAVQFLDEGVEAGEQCLYVSTEQTLEDVRDSFADFPFAVEDEGFDFLSLHASPGQSVTDADDTESQLTLQRLDDEESLGPELSFGEFTEPLTASAIISEFQRYTDYDRVVIDSLNGLSGFTDDHRYRRIVLELVTLLTDDGSATALLTAESDGNSRISELLRYATHGVLELYQERVRDDRHRFFEIQKMRGVDHDTRRVELELGSAFGVRAAPSRRSQPPAVKTHGHHEIGIPGFDELVGGGLVAGAGVLFQHDGRANLSTFLGQFLDAALRRGDPVVVVPTIHLRPGGLATVLDGHGHDLGDLMDDDRLHVVDPIGTYDESRHAVDSPDTAEEFTDAFDRIHAAVGDDNDVTAVVNVDALINTFGADDTRSIRYHEEAALIQPGDTFVHVHNPRTAREETSAFLENTAEQVVETWLADDGLQYVRLQKSPCGSVGTSSLVEYLEDPPYLRVQSPPTDRENPMAEESYPEEYPTAGKE